MKYQIFFVFFLSLFNMTCQAIKSLSDRTEEPRPCLKKRTPCAHPQIKPCAGEEQNSLHTKQQGKNNQKNKF